MTWQAWGRLVVVLAAVVALQLGVMDQLVVGGAHPDVFLLLAIVAGFVAGPQRGAVIAFVVGLTADLFVVTPFGLSSLCYVLVAFATGYAATLGSGRAGYGLRMLVGFAGSVGGTLLFAALATLIGQPALPHSELFGVVAVVSLTNAVLAIPATTVMSWVVTATPRDQREVATLSGGSAAR